MRSSRTEPSAASPLDPERAADQLEAAGDREQIFSLLLRAGRSRAPFAALLSVHRDHLRGRRAAADERFDSTAIADLRLPRGEVPAMEEAIDTGFPYVGDIATGQPDLDGALTALGGTLPRACLLLPILVRQRAVALLAIHRGDEPLQLDDVSDLFPLQSVCSDVLDRLLSERTRAATHAPTTGGAERDSEITELRRLLEVYRQYESWDELADALRELIRRGMTDGDPDEDEQLELWRELGSIEHNLDHPALAIEAWRSGLTIDAGDPGILDSLEQLCLAHERWNDLIELLERRIAIADDLGQRVALLIQVAELSQRRLGDDVRATDAYEQVLRWQPDHAGVAAELEALYRAGGHWTQAASLLVDRAAHADDPVAALEAAAHIYEDEVGDPRAAFLIWIAVMRQDPDRGDPVGALEQLGPGAGAWSELIPDCEQLATELEARHADVAARLWHLVAHWQRDELGNVDSAAAALERALRLDPDAINRLAELVELRRDTGPWVNLAAALGRLADLETDRRRRAQWLAELGELAETRLERPADAVAAYERAVASDPANTAALLSLRRLHREHGSWPALASVLSRLLEVGRGAGDRPRAEQVEVALELGELCSGALPRPDEAARAYARALELDPAAPAVDGLVSALRAGERWSDLAGALRSRLPAVTVSGERVAILFDIAAALERAGDVSGAIRACDDLLEIDPDHSGALGALGRLHEAAGRWTDAHDALHRLAAAASDEATIADAQQRIARIHAHRGDATAAMASFELALAGDPDSADAHEGIARLHADQGKWPLAAHHLMRAAHASAGTPRALRCLADAADIQAHQLGDPASARAGLERVLEAAPHDREAVRLLGDILGPAGQWQALWPHVSRLASHVRSDPDTAPSDRRAVLVDAARCAVEIDQLADALELYDQALEIAADPPLLLARAGALDRSGDREAAAKAYGAIVLQHGASLDPARAAGVYCRMGQIQRELGRGAQASSLFDKALALDPRHRDALRGIVELELERGRAEPAVAALRELVDTLPAGEQPPILEQIGDIQREQLASPVRAAATYLLAAEIDTSNHRVLQKLLDMQSEAGQWREALATIDRFVALETVPVRRGKYLLAAASIHRFQLADPTTAVALYDRAIDVLLAGGDAIDASVRTRALEAFQGIDEVLTAQRDWKRQEKAYRSMIKRLGVDDPVLVTLWHSLGEIHRSRLGQLESAIHAFEVAHSLDPVKQPERVKILGELYSIVGRLSSVPVAEHAAKLLETDPSNPDTYRALAKVCMEARQIDQAWCVCRALVYLKQATPAEQALYDHHQADERRKAKGVLDEESWALVRDVGEDRIVSSIFALTWEGPVALRAGPPKSFDLKPKHRLKIDDDSRLLPRIFQHAARVLAAPLPAVYVQADRAGRLMLANGLDGGRPTPMVIIGRDLMTGYRDTEIAFAVASMLALLRPAYYLRLALSAMDELEAALAASCRLVGRDLAVSPDAARLIDPFHAEMKKRATPESIAVLAANVGRLPERPDLSRWRDAVDAAARRTGLLISGELKAAAAMAAREPTHPGGPSPTEKVRDLVAYSVSSRYFAVRRHLGVNVA